MGDRPWAEAVAFLPDVLSINSDDLGATFSQALDEMRVEVLLPTSAGSHDRLNAPGLAIWSSEAALGGLGFTQDTWVRRHPVAWGERRGPIADLAAIGVRVRDQPADIDKPNQAFRRVDRWARRLVTWAHVSAGPPTQSTIEIKRDVTEWVLGRSPVAPSQPAMVSVYKARASAVAYTHSLESLMAASALAAVGEPDASWLLLLRAESALADGDTRSAVIDSATVLEQVLWAKVEGLAGADPSSLERWVLISQRNATLGRLRRILADLGATPHESLNDDRLVRLRNEVVHRSARQPSGEEARGIVQVARSLLIDHAPLDPVLDEVARAVAAHR